MNDDEGLEREADLMGGKVAGPLASGVLSEDEQGLSIKLNDSEKFPQIGAAAQLSKGSRKKWRAKQAAKSQGAGVQGQSGTKKSSSPQATQGSPPVTFADKKVIKHFARYSVREEILYCVRTLRYTEHPFILRDGATVFPDSWDPDEVGRKISAISGKITWLDKTKYYSAQVAICIRELTLTIEIRRDPRRPGHITSVFPVKDNEMVNASELWDSRDQ